jgi:hypothetical protein
MARTAEQIWKPIAEAELATRGVSGGTGFGRRFEPGTGRIMKEWLSVPASGSRRWKGLVSEAKAFVGFG